MKMLVRIFGHGSVKSFIIVASAGTRSETTLHHDSGT